MESAKESLLKLANQRYALAVCGLIILGGAIRLYRLEHESLWLDEALGVFFARQHLGRSLQSMMQEGLHNSPLFYILLRPFASGEFSEFNGRLMPMIAGMRTIPLIAFMGRRLLSRRAGLLAATSLTLSPYHIWYSRETPMYSLLGLLAVI
jgi:uncharacterized membrane protein